ncbi:MAG: serine/threonine-protein kinase [Candidatus Eremiobacteraeota bacterium]|nr:serine/threonine-protein kinase [Candidatus Eremiobacteraeota bacterium]
MSDDLIGQKLGGFTIQARVGQGGMASVYRAQQHSLDREVALKVIRRIPGDTMDVVARFQREKQMMQKLEHPNILPIYDYASNADYLWIAMRLVEGGTLPETLTPPERLVSIARQLGSALDFAHSHGVVHRDIKPHNVLVDRGDHLYLTDFGVAKMLEQEGLTAPGMAVGTPEYMSPEHLSLKELDGRSDQYALAVMIYQLACGRLPFTGNMMEVMTAHMRTPPPAPGGLPRGAAAAILKAMAKDPGERFASCGEFAEALAAGFDGSRVVAVPASARAGLPLWLKVAVPVLLLGGLAAAALRGRDAGQPGPLVYQATQGDSAEIQIRELDGQIRSLGSGKSPHFGPESGQLTVVRNGELQVVDRNGKKLSKLAEGVEDFDVSPTDLVFSRKGLMKWSLEKGKVKGKPVQLADEGRQPAFSPDGTQLTFAADRAIWIMDSGGRRRSLTSPGPGEKDQFPCWSPDGRQLAFLRANGKQLSLHRISVEGDGKEQTVSLQGVQPMDLSWSPNARIAFTAADGVYSAQPDGSDARRLVESPKGVRLSHPEWGLAKP